MPLDRINIGWIWLERTLNTIIDQVNRQHPISSTSVAVEESPNGTLFKVATAQQTDQASAPKAGSAGAPGPGPPPPPPTGIGQWCQLNVIDTSGGQCVTRSLWYWGTPAK
jgi:hypothetical protein